jgi:hypothetical protein
MMTESSDNRKTRELSKEKFAEAAFNPDPNPVISLLYTPSLDGAGCQLPADYDRDYFEAKSYCSEVVSEILKKLANDNFTSYIALVRHDAYIRKSTLAETRMDFLIDSCTNIMAGSDMAADSSKTDNSEINPIPTQNYPTVEHIISNPEGYRQVKSVFTTTIQREVVPYALEWWVNILDLYAESIRITQPKNLNLSVFRGYDFFRADRNSAEHCFLKPEILETVPFKNLCLERRLQPLNVNIMSKKIHACVEEKNFDGLWPGYFNTIKHTS